MGVVNHPRLDEVWLISLDPTEGSEIQKVRPCLVVSPEEMNRHLQTVIVAPMTTSERSCPTRVDVRFQNKRGQVALDQIRAVDRQRLIRKLGSVSAETADSRLAQRLSSRPLLRCGTCVICPIPDGNRAVLDSGCPSPNSAHYSANRFPGRRLEKARRAIRQRNIAFSILLTTVEDRYVAASFNSPPNAIFFQTTVEMAILSSAPIRLLSSDLILGWPRCRINRYNGNRRCTFLQLEPAIATQRDPEVVDPIGLGGPTAMENAYRPRRPVRSRTGKPPLGDVAGTIPRC